MLLQHIQHINDITHTSHTFTCPCMSVKRWKQSLQSVAVNEVLCFITSPSPCFMNSRVSLSVCALDQRGCCRSPVLSLSCVLSTALPWFLLPSLYSNHECWASCGLRRSSFWLWLNSGLVENQLKDYLISVWFGMFLLSIMKDVYICICCTKCMHNVFFFLLGAFNS